MLACFLLFSRLLPLNFIFFSSLWPILSDPSTSDLSGSCQHQMGSRIVQSTSRLEYGEHSKSAGNSCLQWCITSVNTRVHNFCVFHKVTKPLYFPKSANLVRLDSANCCAARPLTTIYSPLCVSPRSSLNPQKFPLSLLGDSEPDNLSAFVLSSIFHDRDASGQWDTR